MESLTTGQLVLWLVGQLITGAAIWGGIRADIKGINQRISRVEESADQAHERMDTHLETCPARNRNAK